MRWRDLLGENLSFSRKNLEMYLAHLNKRSKTASRLPISS